MPSTYVPCQNLSINMLNFERKINCISYIFRRFKEKNINFSMFWTKFASLWWSKAHPLQAAEYVQLFSPIIPLCCPRLHQNQLCFFLWCVTAFTLWGGKYCISTRYICTIYQFLNFFNYPDSRGEPVDITEVGEQIFICRILQNEFNVMVLYKNPTYKVAWLNWGQVRFLRGETCR